MSFKEIVDEKYKEKSELIAPMESVDALTFVTSHKWLGEKPFPSQSLILKLLYGLWKKYPIIEEEQKLIDTLKTAWNINIDLENRDINQVIEVLILVIGRRGSKSSVVSWIASFEAYKLLCKGNPQKYYKIRERHPIHILNCASDGDQAKETFNLIKDNIKKIDFFQKYIDFDKDNETEMRLFSPYDLFLNSQIRRYNETRGKGSMKKNLLRGSICIESVTTSAATKRGKAIIGLIFDEFAHFGRSKYRKRTLEVMEAPQTDHAMWVALTPSVKDFGKDGLIIAISSPAEKAGEFYTLYCLAGGMEQNESEKLPPNPKYLLLQLSTWQANPRFVKEDFVDDYSKDPVNASMEYGAHFAEPAASFLNPQRIDDMVVEGAPILLRGRSGQLYIIVVDPASTSDTYAIAWGHREDRPTEKYWIDGLKGFEPTTKRLGDGRIIIEPIDSDIVMDFLLTLIRNLNVMGKQVMEICYDQWNCKIGSAKLFTNEGMKTIEELCKENKPILVATKDGFAKAEKFYDNGVRSVVKIRTKFGYEDVGTKNHPFWTKKEWQCIGDLKVGDEVAIQPSALFNKCSTISVNRAIIYGYLTSEGQCSGNNTIIGFSNIEKDILDDYCFLFEQEFGKVPHRRLINKKFYKTRKDSRGNIVLEDTAALWSKEITEELRKHEVLGTSFTKHVPKPIREGSKEVCCAYLSALFEGDGTIGFYPQKNTKYGQTDTYICYDSRSEDLVKDVHLILLNLGIISSRMTGIQVGKPVHRITIRGKNIDRFAVLIGFRGKRKKARLEKVLDHRRPLKKFRVKSYLDNDNIFWDKIISIEEMPPERVYDITVPGKHSFVVNGFITHNSIDSIRTLRKMKLPAFETTFTNPYKGVIYGTFLEKLNQGQMCCYEIDPDPAENWVAKLKLELKYLQKIISGGTTYYAAPTSGPVTTDDFADCCANLVYRLSSRKEMSSKTIRELHKQLGSPIPLGRVINPQKGGPIWGGKKKEDIRDRLRGIDSKRSWR